jgi:tetratricopeptide (TPR) repeat protein
MDDARLRANLKGSWHDRVNLLSDKGRQELEKRLQPAEATLASKPDDLLSLLALARTLEDAGLIADSIEAYLHLYSAYKPAAAWAPRSATRLLARLVPEPDINVVVPARPEERNPDLHARRVGGDQPPSAETGMGPIAPGGEVYALLVGLAKYPNAVGVRNLDYAEADVALFREFLESPRGGQVKHITAIDSSNGTASAIRKALEDLVSGNGGSEKTLIIYIAAHGYYGCVDDHGVPVSGSCDDQHGEPFILTTDTSSDGPRSTGLPMGALQSLIGENAYHFGRVLVYIDVCHAHVLPWSRGRTEPVPVPADAIKANFEVQQGAIGLMMASSLDPNHERELAYESDQLRHGIFTYFVVEGLGGAAKPAGDVVLFRDLFRHVEDRVTSFTDSAQLPSWWSSVPGRITALNNAHAQPFPVPPPDTEKGKITARSRSPRRDPLASPLPPAIASAASESLLSADDRDQFARALEDRRLLPGEPGNAFDAFQQLSANLPESDLKPLRDRLRVALEDAGQQVLILYLQGDQVPQTRADFEHGRQLFEAALALAPAATANESRMLFCAGRVKIFDKQYDNALSLLEQSIRLDPLHGYAYNAMGIALLEQLPNSQMLLEPAIQAFNDARTMEPMWAYPLHNLALAYAQRGDNARAIESYQSAIRIAPAYSYLPYNLGLLYERLNEPGLAEKNFELALKRAAARAARLGVPQDRWVEKAAPLNAIGTLYLSEGRLGAAAHQFELARKADPKYVPALYNTGIVLAARGRREEALQKWREALTVDPNFTAARLSLAQSLLEFGNFENASMEFAEILRLHPDYLAARRSLAQTLVGLCRDGQALDELNRAFEADPGFHDLAAERDDVALVIAGHPPQTRTIKRISAERTCP